ncbi:L-lactate permease, partial [Escherichia coli]|uniref:L-lactate permease n=1 Tax=Escherichia coli TaxID=562 RepID=UPI002976E464|nr:L-lactate permease [Escherichia coli]MDB7218226.1 L-lactate permease [Escherichia coli]MDB8175956.1 L-lactate permease [Escherichia coli]MDB8180803.1 L-lactate permease [Escherichia coli]MDB8185721.1 L-lactate permease [Escherichia coli]
MVTWTQMYMPMGGLGLSALVALIPIIFFFVALAVLRLKGHVAGAITLILSILIAIFGNDSNLLIVFYVQIMPDDLVMQLHR